VTPNQVFEPMKYLKTSGQTLDMSSLLTAFVAGRADASTRTDRHLPV
jgi:hypothetical protein